MEEAIVRGAIVPVQIEYQAPKGIIRPKAAAGMSFYFPGFDKYVSLSAGVNIRIMPKTYLSANYDLDFMPSHIIIVIPDRLASHAVTGGLYFDL